MDMEEEEGAMSKVSATIPWLEGTEEDFKELREGLERMRQMGITPGLGDSDSEDDSEDDESGSRYFNDRRFQSLRRGMSLPPESRTRDTKSMSRENRDTVSMSRDSSPSGARQRRRSGVFTKLGTELPSSLVSSFTKPRNQSPFTGQEHDDGVT